MTDDVRVRPKVAIYKFTSCSGCQQALLNTENELVDILGALDITYFKEAKRENSDGPYDLAIVEGSISMPQEIEILKEVRNQARTLIAVGACAVYGGPQALRNWTEIGELRKASYLKPDLVETLRWTGGIDNYVQVDYRVAGCGPSPDQLVEVITNFLQGRPSALPRHSVCVDCKLAENTCLLVTARVSCLGPVTATGCGAACPSHNRGCFGCFGPMSAANAKALARVFENFGNSADEIVRLFRNQNSNSDAFREVSLAYAQRRRMAA